MRALLAAAVLALSLSACEGKLMTPGDIVQPLVKPTERMTYGPEPSQFMDFWRAQGRGARNAPTVAIIHGGCWQKEYGLELMNAMAYQLKLEGYRVYNIEYRRLGEPGGGYPGTFQDIASALDFIAKRTPDLERMVVIGHSAGGHLALWASARAALPEGSPLITPQPPSQIAAVLSIGGVGDLQAAAADPTFSAACGKDTIAQLVGAGARPGDPYADTSPVRLPVEGVRQVMMHGAREQITPAALGEAYAKAVTEAGGTAIETTVPGAGHFELITPDGAGWSRVVEEVERLSRGSE